jgi:mycothiol synthase
MTDVNYAALPSLAGYSWRALQTTDADSIKALEAAADRADNNEILVVPMPKARDLVAADLAKIPTMCAIAENGEIAGLTWLTVNEGADNIEVLVRGRVHPDHRRRGIGTALLYWAEAKVREQFAESHKPVQVVIRNETLSDDARTIYAKQGFELSFIEHVMQRPYSDGPLPEIQMPEGVTLIPWSLESAPKFFEAYRESFCDRPAFPNPSQTDWIKWTAEEETFRPDLSWVVLEAETPLAFILIDHDPLSLGLAYRAGWITQLGTRISARKRGLSTALLVKAMYDLRDEGLDCTALMVNDNNAKARPLYQKLGFKRLRYRGKYVKAISR